MTGIDMAIQVGRRIGVIMTLSERGGARASLKILGPPTYAKTVRPRATKFGMVIHTGEERVSTPISRGPQRPLDFWAPKRLYGRRPTATKFGTIIHMGQERVSWGHPRPHPKAAGLQRPYFFRDPYLYAKWFGLE